MQARTTRSSPGPLLGRRLWLAPLLGLAVLAAAWLLDCQLSRPAPGVRLGQPVPDFVLPGQDGRSFRLADHRGRAVFLAFLPSLTDPQSVAEARSLEAMQAEIDMAGAKAFFVTDAPSPAARQFHEGLHLASPVLVDAGGQLARALGVPRGARHTLVVDPLGALKFHLRQVEVDRHGKQLVEIGACCLDQVALARADGIGKRIGDFSLPRAADGAMQTVYGDGAQRATVVFFHSVRCPCANLYNDRLRDLAFALIPRGVRFVGIYANADESAEQIAAHARQHGFSFPVLKDERGLGVEHFRARVTPQAFVLDRTGALRYEGRVDSSRDPNEAKTHELREAVEAVLRGTAPPKPTPSFGCAIVRG